MPPAEDHSSVDFIEHEPIEMESAPDVAQPVARPVATPVAAAAPPKRRGILGMVITSLLIVGLLTLTAASVMVALKSIDERDQAEKKLAQVSGAFNKLARSYDNLAIAMVNVKPLKPEALQPFIDHYQGFVASHGNDADLVSELISARLHLAALLVKLKSKEGAIHLNTAMVDLAKLSDKPELDPAAIPSLQGCTLRVTAPIDWAMVKGADQAYYITLLLAIQQAQSSYQKLSGKFPNVITFRDDLSAALKVLALIKSQLPNGKEHALPLWVQGITVNETLVRDQPQNADYNARLVECLVNAARIQKDREGEREAALTNLKRAIEVRQQQATATPDDKTLPKEVEKLQAELAKVEAAPPPKAAEPAAAEPAPEPAPDAAAAQ